jgi:hypothetical protein
MWKELISVPLSGSSTGSAPWSPSGSSWKAKPGSWTCPAYGFSDDVLREDFKRWFGERPLARRKRWTEYDREPIDRKRWVGGTQRDR